MKLVIFDCDGTLVDSQNAIYRGMEHAFGGLGLAVPTRPQVLSVVGLSLPEAFLVLAPDEPGHVRDELGARYKGAFPHTVPGHERDLLFPGAKAAVEALAKRGDVILGIATGKSQRGVRRLLDQEGWHGHFLTIQTADEHPSKPHPSMVLAAMEDAGVEPHATVMIGDTTYDIEMGRNAGVATLGVGWGYHDTAELEAAGAHAIVHRFDDVVDALGRLHARTETET